MCPSVATSPNRKMNGSPAGSWDALLSTQDMMRSESDAYWCDDTELGTVALHRPSSHEAEERSTKSAARERSSSPLLSSTSRSVEGYLSDIDSPDISFFNDSTLVDSTQSPGKAKSSNTSVSFPDGSVLHGLDIRGLTNSNFTPLDGTGVVGFNVSRSDDPVLQGLGIHCLTNANGTSFDGTGIVGIARTATVRRNHRHRGRCHHRAGDETLIDSLEQPNAWSSPAVSYTMINELANAFTSSPAPLRRNGRHRRNTLNNVDLPHPARTQPQNCMPGPDPANDLNNVNDFAETRPLPVLGLGILGLTRNSGTIFDGTGLVGLQHNFTSGEDREDDSSHDLAQQVSRVLLDEVANAFSAADSFMMLPRSIDSPGQTTA